MTKKTVWHTIVQVVCTVAVFLLIAAFSRGLSNTFENLDPSKQGETFDQFMTHGTSIGYRGLTVLLLVWFGMILYTFFRIALSYDRFSKRASVGEPNGLFNRIVRVVSAPSFWIELAAVLLLTFVLPSGFLVAKGFFPFATFPVVAVSFFFARVGAASQAVDVPWGRNIIRMTGIANEMLRILAHVLVIVVGLPFILFVYSNYLLHRNPTIVVVSLAVFGPLLFVLFRAFQKRRKLLKGLGKLCEEKEYSYSIGKAYRSILFPSREPEIRIETGQGTFACVLLNSFSKKTPLYLSRLLGEEGLLVGRGTFSYRTTELRPAFEPNDKKVLVLVPVPLYIFRRSEDDDWHPLYAAEQVGDYSVYSLSAFLNALDLDALDEAKKKRDW